jgi:hypothetical protein
MLKLKFEYYVVTIGINIVIRFHESDRRGLKLQIVFGTGNSLNTVYLHTDTCVCVCVCTATPGRVKNKNRS